MGYGHRRCLRHLADGCRALFETDTWKELPVKKGPWDHARGLAFIPGRNAIALGVDVRSVKVLDLDTGVATTLPHHSPVLSLAVAPNGQAIAAIGRDALLKVWNLGPPVQAETIDVTGSIYALTLSPEGQTVAAGSPNTVRLFDATTGVQTAELMGSSLSIRALAFFRDGQKLISGSARWSDLGEVKVWNIGLDKESKALPEFKSAVLSIAIAPDEKTFAVGGPQGELALFDAGSGKFKVSLKTPQITALTYSRDGKWLISGVSGGKVSVLDPATGAERLTFGPKEAASYIWSMACSPDGTLLATGNNVGLIHLWELSSGRLRTTLRGNITSINSVAFFPDGKTLATANEGGEVKLWDVTTGQERITFRIGKRLAISSDGQMIAAAKDGIVRLLRASAAPAAAARKSEFNPDDPESPLTQIDGADHLLVAGEKVEAEKAYRAAQERLQFLAEQSPHVAEYHQELARTLLRLSVLLPAESDKGAQVRRDLLVVQGKMAAMFPTADDRVLPARMAWGVAAAEQAVADFPDLPGHCWQSADLHFALGWARIRGKRFPEAAEAFREEVARREVLDTKWGSLPAQRLSLERAFNGLGIALDAAGQSDDAIAAHQHALELAKTLAADMPANSVYCQRPLVSHSNLARLLQRSDRLEEAERHYRQVIQSFESNPQQGDSQNLRAGASNGLALLLSRRGHFGEAAEIYHQLIEIKPDSAATYNNLAWLMATCAEPNLRNPSRAVELSQTAVKLEPQNGGHWNTLGVAQYQAGDWKAAIASLNKSNELQGEPTLAFNGFFLAMAHWQLGNKDEATPWYDRAIEWMDKNAPSDQELCRFRSEATELMVKP